MKKKAIIWAAAAMLLVGCHVQKTTLFVIGTSPYDERPVNEKPTMERPAWPNYDIHNENSFAVFSHVASPTKPSDRKVQLMVDYGRPWSEFMTLYRCKEATYVVYSYVVPQDWFFFCFYEGDCIIDADTGDEYRLREVEHFPLNQCFWVHGMEGRQVGFVLVYPPLPDSVKRIRYFGAAGPHRRWFSPSAQKSKVYDLNDLRPHGASGSNVTGRIIR